MAKTGALEEQAPCTKLTELKRELHRLVKTIIDEDDLSVDTFDRTQDTVLALKGLTFNKTSSPALKIESFKDVPRHFLCPISSELMVDPVIVASGQTYDRQFIQATLDAGCRTCPKSQQVLSHTNFIPNNIVREMIAEWCKNHGVELPSSEQNIGIPKGEKEQFDSLIKKVVSPSATEQKQAAKNLRSLTKRLPSFRSLFGENRDAILKLLLPLSNAKADCHPDLQEDLVTTILNLSIHEENKKLVAETPDAIPLLIESLIRGTIATRSNAAAALFSLSALDSNKVLIGEAGAFNPLVDLLEEGHPLAMKDAASAIFNLCLNSENKEKAVTAGAIEVIIKKITDGLLVDELLAILAMLSVNQNAVEEMSVQGAVPLLLNIIKGTTCQRTKENSIVILYAICYSDRTRLKEIKEEEKANGSISLLAQNGTSRAKRKASSILQRLNIPLYNGNTA